MQMLKTYETIPPSGRVWYCSKLHHTFTTTWQRLRDRVYFRLKKLPGQVTNHLQ